ncbi:MAG: ferrous iron transporter B [Clostridia bacterium]|nr:ferrous iron transporter B [Clostridia bacterium]
MKILLVGNPNVGKSTLFNTITKSNAHTGNWHGVTTQTQEKNFYIKNQQHSMVDLPGIYSLSPNSYEEQVAIEYILSNPQSPILCLCSNVSLQHNFLLLTELLQLGRKVILVINNISTQININVFRLEQLLKIKVLMINTKRKDQVINLLSLIQKNEFYNNNPFEKYEMETKHIKNQIKIDDVNMLDFFCYKAVCGCEFYINKLKEYNPNLKIERNNFEVLEKSIQKKYEYIDKLLFDCKFKQSKVVGKSKFDKFMLNRYLCIPIFICIIAFVFYITFFSVGRWLSDGFRYFLQDVIGENVSLFLKNTISINWIVDMINVAIFGGVATVVSFLPQLVLLFLFLDVLEQSGYISRLAFMLDDMLKKVGLTGKSVYTLIMGFGCSTTA